MAKVILDAETFKALASPTRLAVLKALDQRRKTVTELSKELELNKATVHEHLQLLVATGLIKKRDDEGRKWIYYELTWEGQRILHPQETTTFMVLLGLSVAAAGGGVAVLGRALGLWWTERQALRGLDERGPYGGAGGARGADGADADGAEDATATEAADGPDEPSEDHDAAAAEDSETGGAPSQADAAAHTTDAGSFSTTDNRTIDDAFNGTRGDAPQADQDLFVEEDGILGLALLLAAILFTVLAGLVRRSRK